MEAFLNDPAGLALKGMLVAAFTDFAFGSFAALRDGSFTLDALAAFVRKHLLGRVAPIGTLLALGYFNNDVVMTTAGVAAGAAYVAETLGSIYGSIKPPQEAPAAVESAAMAGNPIPQD
jgi:hypothetical protein